jgi:hypothetical protein
MKKHTEKELIAIAGKMQVTESKGKTVSVLEANSKVYATEDGQIFGDNDYSAAMGHARSQRIKLFTLSGKKKAGYKEKEQAAVYLVGLKQVYKQLTNSDAGDISEAKLEAKIEALRADVAAGRPVGQVNAEKPGESAKNVGTGKDTDLDKLREEYSKLYKRDAPLNILKDTLKAKIAEAKKASK